jgi:uroporphyrinogen decarboxylase
VYQAATMLSSSLDRPLIGFSGAPWTLAAYVIEGESSKEWPKTHAALRNHPPHVQKLISALEELVIAHLSLQIEAGVDAVQIFDSQSSLLPPSLFQEFAILPLQRIVRQLPPCPVIIYTANATTAPLYARTISVGGVSCDNSVDMTTLRTLLPSSVALQGNLNPQLLLGDTRVLTNEIRRICDCMRKDTGFIFNLSGGVPPQTEEKTIRLLVETVRENVRP